jgi:glutamyl/glutaminyl-tRNA synthetase
MARANNGTFILRIDDTDQARNRTEWIDYIYDQMNEYGFMMLHLNNQID